MNAAHGLLDLARKHRITLTVDGDRLKMRAPSAPPPEVVDAIKRAKPILMAALSASAPLDEERAAIVQHDAGIAREWADGFAQLHPDHPPADVPVGRWCLFIDDCGRFLASRWPARCIALGWGPADLFGCDRDKPFARIDRAGLLWLMVGAKLIALSETTATIETASGARQTYRRRPNEPARTMAWELDVRVRLRATAAREAPT